MRRLAYISVVALCMLAMATGCGIHGGGVEPGVTNLSGEPAGSVVGPVPVPVMGGDITGAEGSTGTTEANDPGVPGSTQDPEAAAGEQPVEFYISEALYDEPSQTLAVTVVSPYTNDHITCQVEEPFGLAVDATEKPVSDSAPRQVSFQWQTIDPYQQIASGTVKIDVWNEYGSGASAFIDLAAYGIKLEPDTLYAIPEQNTVRVGDPVRITVATGELPNPMAYLVGATATFENTGAYVPYSFDYGLLGGGNVDLDGMWATTGAEFLLAPSDWMLSEKWTREFGCPDRCLIMFNVTPVYGGDITAASGTLCSFELKFSKPGEIHLGLLDATLSILRSYYRDRSGNDYCWGKLMAGKDGVLNVEGADNKITVTAE